MPPREFWLAGALSAWVKGLVILLTLTVCALPLQAKEYEAERQRIDQFFPDVQSISEPEGEYQVRTLRKGDEVLGYAFQSINVTKIPAYSGKPINMQVLLDPQGVIRDAYVLEHHEPILLIGIPEEKLHEFNAKYEGIKADQRVVVGRSKDSNAVTIDAVTGATVTVMVVNEVVMRAAHEVAVSLGLIEAGSSARPKLAIVREDVFQPADWTELTGSGAIRRLHLTRGQIDESFKGTEAEGVDEATAETAEDTFIDLYVTQIGRAHV